MLRLPHFICIGSLLLGSAAHAEPATNKQIVANFIHDVFVARDVEAARKYLAIDYIQHNPNVAPGADGFVRSMRDWLRHAPTDLSDDTLHLVAEGDFVVAHQQLSYSGKDGKKVTVTGFDLYRLKQGKIVEHWDSDQ